MRVSFILELDGQVIQYAAKKEDNPEEALKSFKSIVEKEEKKGDWFELPFTTSAVHLILVIGDSKP